MDGNGDRQRITDLERRMVDVESGMSSISEQIGALRTDLAVGFAKLETRKEAEDRDNRHHPGRQEGSFSLMDLKVRDLVILLSLLGISGVSGLMDLLQLLQGG